MKISIAIATYNGEKYLREQLDSLARQTLLPDELVICDDRSSDRTLEIIRAFANDAPFDVHLFANTENLGFARNFEKAISLASGDLIMLCDQDDRWEPDKVETLHRVFDRNPGVFVALTDAWVCDEQLHPLGHTTLQNNRGVGIDDSFYVHGCTSAHRRAWNRVILPLPDGQPHDFWINHMAAAAGLATVIDVPKVYYRCHSHSASDSKIARTGLRDLWRGHGLANADEQWRKMIGMYELAENRIASNGPASGLAPGLMETARTRLRQRQEAYRRRIEVTSRPRWRRPVAILRMVANGQYRTFLGWRSALKDLIRP